jgi:hypothetical protein
MYAEEENGKDQFFSGWQVVVAVFRVFFFEKFILAAKYTRDFPLGHSHTCLYIYVNLLSLPLVIWPHKRRKEKEKTETTLMQKKACFVLFV